MTRTRVLIDIIAIATLAGTLLNAGGCASQSKSCCGETTTCCATTATSQDEVQRSMTVLGDNFDALRAAFNKHDDRWRAVALVSPTCSECVYGAEAVRKEITDRYPADRVETISIWIPMLSTDNEQAARNSASIFPPEGVPQFYDSRQNVGWAYARGTFAGFIDRARKTLPSGHYLAEAFDDPQHRDRPQWDLYMLYAPGVRWDQAPPVPTHWIRHCGRTDGQKSTYWVDSPDAPPRAGNLFEAMRQMADGAIGPATVSDANSRLKIELLGFPSCPNTPTIRANLASALRGLKGDPGFSEVNLESLPPSDARRGWGAPTILVDGRDLMGMSPPTSNALSCRTYPGDVPSSAEIARRLRTMPEAPRCALEPAELQARRAELLPGLRERAEQVTKLENGFRMQFKSRPGLLDELTHVIEQERTCCSFLRFKIEVEPEGGPVALEVTGPPGARDMLDRL